MIEHLTKETFKEKIFDFDTHQKWKFEGELPCIIDFYADWCGPCKMVAPLLEELAEEFKGKLNIYKASIFRVQSIPSLLFVPLNDQPQMALGALPKETFIKAFRDVLKVE